jgi:hypothetical protein
MVVAVRAASVGSRFVIHKLIQSARWKAYAFTPRAALEPLADWRRVKSRSVRARLQLEAVRRGDVALAEEIVPMLYRQRAYLAIAQAAFARGDVRTSLRYARRVRDHRLVAWRQLLFAEIGFILRRRVRREVSRKELEDANAWTQDHLLYALMRTDCFEYEQAAVHLISARVMHDERARTTFLAMLERARHDIVRSLVAIRATKRGGVADCLLAEYVRSLEPQPAITRAEQDEAIAMSSEAPRHRRVLVDVARACLRKGQDVESRLRSLVHLGGSLASDAIAANFNGLAWTPRMRALEALAMIDPRAAMLRTTDEHVLRIAELCGGVRRGHALACGRVVARLARAGLNAEAWLTELAAVLGHAPDLGVFELLLARELPASPRDLVDADALAVLSSDAHDRILAKVPIEALMIARPARVGSTMQPWTATQWRALFTRLQAHDTYVEHTTLVACAKLLGLADYAPLRLGQLPGVRTLTKLGRYQLRLLDKRHDLLTYLRFPDIAVHSCYRSDSRMYAFETQLRLFDAWRDPLTMCFHIESIATGEPCGFVFGSFVEVDGAPGAVFNSLHLRPRAERFATLRALESALAPLGLAHLGIANLYGGRGALPPNYQQRPARFRRLRALGRGSTLVRDAYDDITSTSNLTVREDHLFWRS